MCIQEHMMHKSRKTKNTHWMILISLLIWHENSYAFEWSLFSQNLVFSSQILFEANCESSFNRTCKYPSLEKKCWLYCFLSWILTSLDLISGLVTWATTSTLINGRVGFSSSVYRTQDLRRRKFPTSTCTNKKPNTDWSVVYLGYYRVCLRIKQSV